MDLCLVFVNTCLGVLYGLIYLHAQSASVPRTAMSAFKVIIYKKKSPCWAAGGILKPIVIEGCRWTEPFSLYESPVVQLLTQPSHIRPNISDFLVFVVAPPFSQFLLGNVFLDLCASITTVNNKRTWTIQVFKLLRKLIRCLYIKSITNKRNGMCLWCIFSWGVKG